MPHELNDQDLFLLGTLSENTTYGALKLKRLPRGCSHTQLLHLMHAGYLTLIHRHSADDECRITEEGQKAWQTYGFKR
jgi:hypothetical protein